MIIAELDSVLVKFHISIEIGDILPIVKLNNLGDMVVVDVALDMMEIDEEY